MLEAFRRARAAAGPNLALTAKLNCEDFIQDGFSLAESCEAARALAAEGPARLELRGQRLVFLGDSITDGATLPRPVWVTGPAPPQPEAINATATAAPTNPRRPRAARTSHSWRAHRPVGPSIAPCDPPSGAVC